MKIFSVGNDIILCYAQIKKNRWLQIDLCYLETINF